MCMSVVRAENMILKMKCCWHAAAAVNSVLPVSLERAAQHTSTTAAFDNVRGSA